VAIGVIEVGVPPAPFHHARHLGNVETPLNELAAEAIKVSNLEIETHTFAYEGRACAGLMERDGPIASRRT